MAASARQKPQKLVRRFSVGGDAESTPRAATFPQNQPISTTPPTSRASPTSCHPPGWSAPSAHSAMAGLVCFRGSDANGRRVAPSSGCPCLLSLVSVAFLLAASNRRRLDSLHFASRFIFFRFSSPVLGDMTSLSRLWYLCHAYRAPPRDISASWLDCFSCRPRQNAIWRPCPPSRSPHIRHFIGLDSKARRTFCLPRALTPHEVTWAPFQPWRPGALYSEGSTDCP